MANFGIRVCVLALSMMPPSCNSAEQSPAKTLAFDKSMLITRPDSLTIGVAVHFGIGGEYNYVAEKSAELLRELGADSYRDDLPWNVFDSPGSVPGRYQPKKLFDFMAIASGKPLLVAGYPHPLVPGGNPPLDEAGRKAFSDFFVRAARATQPFQPIYEVWNEWNMNAVAGRPWLTGAGEASDPRAAVNYAALAKATVAELRRAVPEATLLAGAVGVDPQWQWAKAVVDDGATRDAALSVHLYNQCEADLAKRTASEMIDRLQDLQAKIAGNGPPVPLYVTEFGWPTALKTCVISRQTAADNIAQFLFWSSATPWVKGTWIYQLKDQGTNLDDMESTFGLYDYDYKPKPAACAVRNAIRLIRSAGASRLERPFPDVFVLHLSSETGTRLVAWTGRDAAKATLELPAGSNAGPLCNGKAGEIAGPLMLGPEPIVIDMSASGPIDVKVRELL